MKVRLRITLIALLIGLIISTVTAVGVASFLNSRFAAEVMADQILAQTSLHVDQQLDKVLSQATGQTTIALGMLRTQQLQSRDFQKVVTYWKEALAISPDVASLYLGRADTGECVGVSRLQGDRFTVWQSTRLSSGRLEQREFWIDDYPDRTNYFDPARQAPDIRTRPWFMAAQRRGRGVWTDTFVFLGLEGLHTVFGLTYAAPVYGSDGQLDAVVSADFELDGLCRFLSGLHVGKRGFAFLLEVQADGGRRVIAHPQSELLLRPVPGADPSERELATAGAVKDDRVLALLAALPAGSEITTLGFSGRIRFTLHGEGYLASFRQLQGEDRPRWLICTVLPENDVLWHARQTSQLTLWIALAAIVLSIAISVAVAQQVARPLESLARMTADIGQFRLEEKPPVGSFVLEVDRLSVATEEMKAGLRSFKKFVPAELVRAMLQTGKEARIGGERRTLTLFFSDIAGFTALAESLPEEVLVSHLGQYLEMLSEQILASGGTVDKYIGDAIMAFWGAPVANSEHAVAACIAAVSCQRQLRIKRLEWRTNCRPLFPTRIGLHTGEVIVGNIGSANRLNYTAIGDAVNLASRLEGLNKQYGTECLLSEETALQAGAAIVTRPLDWVAVAGRRGSVLIHELIGLPGEVDSTGLILAERYEKALNNYRKQDWAGAIALLEETLEICPGDGPSCLLAARCLHYRDHPPGDDWDGIYRLDRK